MKLTRPANGLLRVCFWLCVPALIGLAYYLLLVWNPLPDDEELITHFQTHRADFEEAVRRYRAHPRPADKDTSLWFKEGDTLDLFKRAGIRYINSATPVWFPNPYSVETAKKIDYELIVLKNHTLSHKYGALDIDLDPRDRYYAHSLRYVVIWKSIYFIPQVPRIENGELLWPVRSNGEYFKRRRVFTSLNHLPYRWKDFECVYRQIEPQWFLRMCNGH